jgi:hypothetical protein
MNRDILDGRMERDLLRRHLAMKLIGHRARTKTIENLTGLTRHQLETLRRGAGVPTESRFRGSAPISFSVFFRTVRRRDESAVLAFIYLALDASRLGTRNGSSDAAIAHGERLCDVYETWQYLFPGSQIEFDQLALLGEGVTRGDQISIRQCRSCPAIVLVDLLSAHRPACGCCTRARREDKLPQSSQSGNHRDDEEADLLLYSLQLLGGKLLRERKGIYTLVDGST